MLFTKSVPTVLKYFFVIVVWILFTVVFGCYILVYSNNQTHQTHQTHQSAEITYQEPTEFEIRQLIIEEISNWVYLNSSKIPFDLSYELVVFVYKNCQYPKLTLAIIHNESHFDIFAFRNDTKVYGLGQIRYHIWADQINQFDIEEPRDLFNWKKNILAINYIVTKYYNQTNDLRKTLQKYVGGKHEKYITGVLEDIGELSLIEETFIKNIIIEEHEILSRRINSDVPVINGEDEKKSEENDS